MMSAMPATTSRTPPADPDFHTTRFTERTNPMLMTIAIVLIILWALGLVTSTTLGGFIHVLLVIAIIVILVRVIQGRRIL
jgi:hypothetical protein